MRDFSGVS